MEIRGPLDIYVDGNDNSKDDGIDDIGNDKIMMTIKTKTTRSGRVLPLNASTGFGRRPERSTRALYADELPRVNEL